MESKGTEMQDSTEGKNYRVDSGVNYTLSIYSLQFGLYHCAIFQYMLPRQRYSHIETGRKYTFYCRKSLECAGLTSGLQTTDGIMVGPTRTTKQFM